MSLARTCFPVLVTTALVAACSDAPTTPLVAPTDSAPTGLDFAFPAFHRDLLVMQDSDGSDAAERTGPALVVSEGEEPTLPGTGVEVPPDAVANIFSPYTFVYFNPGHVFAQGEHRYQGNKSRIETTLNVSFDGQLLGSQLGVKEQSSVFLLNLMQTTYIQAIARIFTDQTCGLSANASSQHRAWWEAVIGGPVSSFGGVATSSFATQRHQPDCPPPVIQTTTGGSGGGSGGDAYCWVSIWYDINTGEVLDVEVLWCEEIGG